MPFPKLQHLRLTGLSGIKARDMLAMVRARFASPAIPTGAAYRDAPVPMTIHLGNGVGGWRNKVMDDILATPGVKEVRDSYEDLAGIGSSSSSSSESEWPPPYNYFVDGEFNWTESEGSLQDWDEEVDVDIDWGEEVDAEDIGGEEVDAEDIDMNF
ncbi:hypothetical protein FRC01_014612 [Tulasnella sp. 417]|nr:hypothetical protein FRC01_014612 [Tulasnella sp. 417]